MTKVERIAVYSILGVLFILAAIFDYSISQGLFQPDNILGRLGETLGEVVCYGMGVFAACLLAFRHPKFSTKVHRFFLIFFTVGAVGGSVYCGYHTNKLLMRAFYLSYGTGVKIAIIGVIALVVFALCFFLARLVKPDHSGEALAFGLFVLVLIATSLLLMQALKMVWLRPRYRTLVALKEAGAITSIEDYWKNFWEPQFFTSFSKYTVGGEYGFTQGQIDSVMKSLGITEWSKEEFYAFPSGHTMNSFAVVAITYLPRLFDKLNKRKYTGLVLRIVAYLYVALIAFTRILRGAHSAVDVLTGYIIAFTLFTVYSHFFYERFMRQKIIPPMTVAE